VTADGAEGESRTTVIIRLLGELPANPPQHRELLATESRSNKANFPKAPVVHGRYRPGKQKNPLIR